MRAPTQRRCLVALLVVASVSAFACAVALPASHVDARGQALAWDSDDAYQARDVGEGLAFSLQDFDLVILAAVPPAFWSSHLDHVTPETALVIRQTAPRAPPVVSPGSCCAVGVVDI